MNDLFTKDCEKQMAEINREFTRVIWKALSQEKNAFINRVKVKYDAAYARKRKAEINEKVKDAYDKGDYASAFEFIESDQFETDKFWNEASSRVYEKRKEKFSSRVSNPYACRDVILLNEAA